MQRAAEGCTHLTLKEDNMYDEYSMNKQITGSDAYFVSSCVIGLTVQ